MCVAQIVLCHLEVKRQPFDICIDVIIKGQGAGALWFQCWPLYDGEKRVCNEDEEECVCGLSVQNRWERDERRADSLSVKMVETAQPDPFDGLVALAARVPVAVISEDEPRRPSSCDGKPTDATLEWEGISRNHGKWLFKRTTGKDVRKAPLQQRLKKIQKPTKVSPLNEEITVSFFIWLKVSNQSETIWCTIQ